VIAPYGGPKSEIIFTEVVKGKKFIAQCKLPLCVMRFEHELDDAMGSGMRKTLPNALAGLKKTAEATV
jgi:hypothetical protein